MHFPGPSSTGHLDVIYIRYQALQHWEGDECASMGASERRHITQASCMTRLIMEILQRGHTRNDAGTTDGGV